MAAVMVLVFGIWKPFLNNRNLKNHQVLFLMLAGSILNSQSAVIKRGILIWKKVMKLVSIWLYTLKNTEASSGNHGWTYDGNYHFPFKIRHYSIIILNCFTSDPNGWESVSPECGGERQSPVGIDSTKAIPSSQMPAITFDNYDIVFRQTITNNGHTGNKIFLK